MILKYFRVKDYKPGFSNWIVLFLLLIPLLIGDFITKWLMIPLLYYGNNKYTPVLIVAFLSAVVLFVALPKKGRRNKNLRNKLVVSTLFILFIVFQLVVDITQNPWVRLIEIILPVIFSILLIRILPENIKSTEWILKKILLLFILYSVAYFLLWLFKTRFIFDIDQSLGFARFRTALTGSVTYGQLIATIPLFFLLTIRKQNFFMYLLAILFTIGLVYLTGTRSAIYAILIVAIFIVLFNFRRNLKLILISFIILLITIYFINLFDFSYERYLNTASSRQFSQVASLKITSLDSYDLIFGKGLSNFFPYEDFYKASQSGILKHTQDQNIFRVQNVDLLVEPHSSYVWLIVETGLIGFLLFIVLIFPSLRRAIIILINLKKYNNIFIGLSLFTLIILISSFAGSFLINEPYVATICWFLIFLIEEYYKNYFLYEKKS